MLNESIEGRGLKKKVRSIKL